MRQNLRSELSNLSAFAERRLRQFRQRQSWVFQLLREPQLWPSLLVQAPTPVARRLLSLASGVIDPHLLTQGLEVEKWSEWEVGLRLKGALWAKSLSWPQPSISSLAALADLSLRLVWDWQARVRGPSEPLKILKMDWELVRPLKAPLQSRYQVSRDERDRILFALQRTGEASFEGEILFLDEKDQLLVRASFQAIVRARPSLPSR